MLFYVILNIKEVKLLIHSASVMPISRELYNYTKVEYLNNIQLEISSVLFVQFDIDILRLSFFLMK